MLKRTEIQWDTSSAYVGQDYWTFNPAAFECNWTELHFVKLGHLANIEVLQSYGKWYKCLSTKEHVFADYTWTNNK